MVTLGPNLDCGLLISDLCKTFNVSKYSIITYCVCVQVSRCWIDTHTAPEEWKSINLQISASIIQNPQKFPDKQSAHKYATSCTFCLPRHHIHRAQATIKPWVCEVIACPLSSMWPDGMFCLMGLPRFVTHNDNFSPLPRPSSCLPSLLGC